MASITKYQLHDNKLCLILNCMVALEKLKEVGKLLSSEQACLTLISTSEQLEKIPAIDVGLANLSAKGVKTQRVTGKIRRYLNIIHRGKPVLPQKGGIAPLLFLTPLAAKAAELAPFTGKAILGGALSSGTGFGIQKLQQKL